MVKAKQTLELYYFDECPYCQIVLKTIKDLGISSLITLSQVRKDQSKADFLLKTTGRKTVPCLFIDGKPMHESADIANWLKKEFSPQVKTVY